MGLWFRYHDSERVIPRHSRPYGVREQTQVATRVSGMSAPAKQATKACLFTPSSTASVDPRRIAPLKEHGATRCGLITKKEGREESRAGNIFKLQDDSPKVTFLNCLTGKGSTKGHYAFLAPVPDSFILSGFRSMASKAQRCK
jgi:hypothetical protein